MNRPATKHRKPRLLGACGATALSAALAAAIASPAAGQSFNGEGNVVAGSAFISISPDNTLVEVNSDQVVINWDATDFLGTGSVDFQSAGTTATFINGSSSVGDYTVLNRIIPLNGNGGPAVATISMNGVVESYVDNAVGGNLWFYTPYGMVIGSTASFNTGSLILTTSNIAYSISPVGGASILYGANGEISFTGVSAPDSFVEVQAGATITAETLNSSVAIAAPRVQMDGQVSASGPIAYIGAESLELRVNSGLFDITVLTGTTDAHGVVHTGITGGPAADGVTQRIAMVAMPQSQSIAMLVSGSVGYDQATVATQDGSAIVLSTGFPTDVPQFSPSDQLGSISIGAGTFSNLLTVYASDSISINPGPDLTAFQADTTLYARNGISLTASGAGTIDAATNLSLRAGGPGAGGTISLAATGGTISVAETLFLDVGSNALPYDLFQDGSATGGTITLLADVGGTISATTLQGTASAYAVSDGPVTYTGQGGDIALTASEGGLLSFVTTSLDADGAGNFASFDGGDGIGGTVAITGNGGQLELGQVFLSASGFGGNSSGQGGDATGGAITIGITGGTHDWQSLDAYAQAVGASGSNGSASGSAQALDNAISLTLDGGAELALDDYASLYTDTFVGVDGPAGYGGQAGGISVSITDGAALSADSAILLQANANLDTDLALQNSDTAPVQQGGSTSLIIDGGSLITDSLTLRSNAYTRGASQGAGSATGGSATIAVNGSLRAGLGDSFSGITVEANGVGSAGIAPGTATGGDVSLTISGGTVLANGEVSVRADGLALQTDGSTFFSLPDGDGPDTSGGSASVSLTGATASLQAGGALIVSAAGDATTQGNGSFSGDGGTGTGGDAQLTISAGSIRTFAIAIDASGRGGNSGQSLAFADFGYQSGDGEGGSATFLQTGGAVQTGSFAVQADGFGGTAGAETVGSNRKAAAGGDGAGGTALLSANAGTLRATSLLAQSRGTGGTGMTFAAGEGTGGQSEGGNGGAGDGGSATISFSGTVGLTMPGTVDVLATGSGGAGGVSGVANGNGGDADGGSATLALGNIGFTFGATNVAGSGTGGAGRNAGDGTGGTASLLLADTGAGPYAPRRMASLTLDGSGTAGAAQGSGLAGTANAGAVTLRHQVAAGSGLTVTGGLSATATGSTAPAAGNGITVVTAGADLQVNGGLASLETSRTISMTGSASAALSAANAVTITGRQVTGTGHVTAGTSGTVTAPQGIAMARLATGGPSVLLATSGAIDMEELLSGAPASAQGTAVEIDSTGALTFSALTATDGALTVRTVGNLQLPAAAATGSVTLASSAGSVQGPSVTGGGAVSVTGATGVILPVVTSGGATTLLASNGAVTVADNIASTGAVTARGRSVTLNATGALNVAEAQATAGNVALTAAPGITLGQATASGDVTLTASGGPVAITGPASAVGTFAVSSGSVLNVTGSISGATVNATSTDIAIGANGRIGTRGTTTRVTLTNGGSTSTGTTTIGGTGGTSSVGYVLDSAEIQRVFADQGVTIAAGASPVTISDFALTYGQQGNIGTGGELKVLATGTVRVTGAVDLTTASGADLFSIDPDLIEVQLDTASISMTSATGGAPQGTLELVGNTLAIADNATLSAIGSATGTTAISDLLDTPATAAGGDAVMTAGTIRLDATDALYIQNTGSGTDFGARGGFLAQDVLITTAGPDTVIAINGQIDGDTGIVSGLAVTPLVTINDVPAATGGQFDSLSTINGCVIGTNCATVNPPAGPDQPDLITGEELDARLPDGIGMLDGLPIIEVIEQEPLIALPLVDEPITGVGNDDLWDGTCDEGEEACQ